MVSVIISKPQQSECCICIKMDEWIEDNQKNSHFQQLTFIKGIQWTKDGLVSKLYFYYKRGNLSIFYNMSQKST